MPTVFVSYRRNDSAYVSATITEALERQFGPDSVFFDIDAIPLGTDFRDHIAAAVEQCDVLLAIIGDGWANASDKKGQRLLDDPADFVRLEIESALERQIPVIPVLVGNALIPIADDLPQALRPLSFRNAEEVRAGRDLQQHLYRLVAGIEALTESRPAESGRSIRAIREPSRHRHRRNSPSRRATAAKRLACTILTLASTVVTGIVTGLIGANIGGGDSADWLWKASVPTWVVGFVLTYLVWTSFDIA